MKYMNCAHHAIALMNIRRRRYGSSTANAQIKKGMSHLIYPAPSPFS
ncbi:MAG: hypothetical protein AB1742_10410 [bacterium]